MIWKVNSVGQRVEGGVSELSLRPVGLDKETIAAMGEHPVGHMVVGEALGALGELKNGDRVRISVEKMPAEKASEPVSEPASQRASEPGKIEAKA